VYRWRMCVEADGRDTDRELHNSGGLVSSRGRNAVVWDVEGNDGFPVSPLRSPPGVAGQLAKRLCAVQSRSCVEGRG